METPIDAAPIEPSGDQVVDWWNSDGKANESLDVDSCPTGAWEHYRMNGNSGDEAGEKAEDSQPPSSSATRNKPRIPSSYPASFAAHQQNPTRSGNEQSKCGLRAKVACCRVKSLDLEFSLF